MQKYVNISLGVIIVLLLSFFFLYSNDNIKEYSKKFSSLNKNVVVKIYSKDSKKANRALSEIEKIYDKYDKLVDNKKSYENITNVYDLNNATEEKIIDKSLYDLISYGKSWYSKSNNLVNINQNNINSIWEKYRINSSGVPTKDELINFNDSNGIVLKNNKKIGNDNLSIDLNLIVRSYVTNEVKQYLKTIDIKQYLINIGGTILVGDYYNNGDYKIGIEDPNEKDGVIKIIHGNNIGIVTLGNYEEYYDYNDIRYNHVIDPNTLYPANNMKSITLISKDIKDLSALTNMLFLMTVEDGKKYVENTNDLEAIWISNDDTIISSSGIFKYE